MGKQNRKVVATILTCEECDDYKSLLVDGEEVLCGDYYHDKIDKLINGYIGGMEFCGYDVEVKAEYFICPYCELEMDLESKARLSNEDDKEEHE